MHFLSLTFVTEAQQQANMHMPAVSWFLSLTHTSAENVRQKHPWEAPHLLYSKAGSSIESGPNKNRNVPNSNKTNVSAGTQASLMNALTKIAFFRHEATSEQKKKTKQPTQYMPSHLRSRAVQHVIIFIWSRRQESGHLRGQQETTRLRFLATFFYKKVHVFSRFFKAVCSCLQQICNFGKELRNVCIYSLCWAFFNGNDFKLRSVSAITRGNNSTIAFTERVRPAVIYDSEGS